jgi:hypothetical protein
MRVRILSSLIIVIASIVSLYLYKDYTDKNAIKIAQLEQKDKIKAKNNANITKMLADYNAIDWVNQLAEKYKKGSIKLYSHDIQILWVSKRPILFIGVIKDITDYNGNLYLLSIKRYGYSRGLPIVLPGNSFELSLLANKSYIDKFLDSNAGLRSNKGHKNVAVIANINSVDTKHESYEDSDVDVFTGNGNLLNIYFIDGSI